MAPLKRVRRVIDHGDSDGEEDEGAGASVREATATVCLTKPLREFADPSVEEESAHFATRSQLAFSKCTSP
jgi:hypothetical protein